MSKLARALPKFPLMPAQCASCPFKVGNDAELGAVILGLRKKFGMRETVHAADIKHTRMRLRIDAQSAQNFLCHASVYDREMDEKPRHEHRTCPGSLALKTLPGPGRE